MSIIDDLNNLQSCADEIRSLTENGVPVLSRGTYFGSFINGIITTLTNLLGTMGNVISLGEPYPPSALTNEKVVAAETIAVGDGSDDYAGIYVHFPIIPGSVSITATSGTNTLTVTDDGSGNLIGDVDPAGVNTIHYDDGDFDIKFSDSVDGASNIVSAYDYYNMDNTQVSFEWTKGEGNIDGHRLYRSPAGGGAYALVTPGAFPTGDITPAATVNVSDDTVVAGTAYDYVVRGFNYVANPTKEIVEWDDSNYAASAFPRDITANVTDAICLVAPYNGRIATAGLYLNNTGTINTNPLELEADVKIGGTSIFTTLPKLTTVAADGASTLVAGVGITQAVIDDTINSFSIGDTITVTLDLTRTDIPTDEMAGAIVILGLDIGDSTESDDSNMVNVTVPV